MGPEAEVAEVVAAVAEAAAAAEAEAAAAEVVAEASGGGGGGGGGGAAATAAKASSLPSPQTLLSAAVPPRCGSDVSKAVASSRAAVAAMFPRRAGISDQRSATVPATCGEAMDVPLDTAYEFVGMLLRR